MRFEEHGLYRTQRSTRNSKPRWWVCLALSGQSALLASWCDAHLAGPCERIWPSDLAVGLQFRLQKASKIHFSGILALSADRFETEFAGTLEDKVNDAVFLSAMSCVLDCLDGGFLEPTERDIVRRHEESWAALLKADQRRIWIK